MEKAKQVNCDIREDIVKIISETTGNRCYQRLENYIIGIRRQDKVAIEKRIKSKFNNGICWISPDIKMKIGDTIGFSMGRKHFTIARDE